MTAEEFLHWEKQMQQAGRVRAGHGAKNELAAALGITRMALNLMEREGTKQRQTDLACSALLGGLAPYPN